VADHEYNLSVHEYKKGTRIRHPLTFVRGRGGSLGLRLSPTIYDPRLFAFSGKKKKEEKEKSPSERKSLPDNHRRERGKILKNFPYVA